MFHTVIFVYPFDLVKFEKNRWEVNQNSKNLKDKKYMLELYIVGKLKRDEPHIPQNANQFDFFSNSFN